MLIEHRGLVPVIAASAYVAPTAVLCGDVNVGADCRIMFGAVLVAEDSSVTICERTVIMENAVLRAWPGHPVVVGNDVMIGQAANINGAQIDDDAFIATGACVFPGAHVGSRSIVRMNAVVHMNTELPANRVVPEGWTAIGRPAEVVPPGDDERRLFSFYGMNFTKAIFGEKRTEVGMKHYLDLLGAHVHDRQIDE
jgi:carbonic anhydrase/acetyltransferase-like protein (isoleucine patch superfamily)